MAVLIAACSVSRAASAYPWMIAHEYAGCVPCHADPSGAGVLTEYGRAQSELLLRTHYGPQNPDADEAAPWSRFLGFVKTPSWLLLGGAVRDGVQVMAAPTPTVQGGKTTTTWSWSNPTFLDMQADLQAQVSIDRFRANGSLGFVSTGDQPMQITQGQQDNLVSREHWLGFDLGSDKEFLLRAGRINLPFGIRTDEHELFVRSKNVTRTNINDSQQDGVSFAHDGSWGRFEVMGILGNYLIGPDTYRERGYAGYVELSLTSKAAAGLSSLVTYAGTDYVARTKNTTRQVHGAYTRLAPLKWLVVFSEVDALITSSDTAGTASGFASFIQANVEPIQGLHFLGTGEAALLSAGNPQKLMSYSGGLAALWFFMPHADVRFDFVAYSFDDSPVTYYLLPQLHLFL